jgi:hypothetical protein
MAVLERKSGASRAARSDPVRTFADSAQALGFEVSE